MTDEVDLPASPERDRYRRCRPDRPQLRYLHDGRGLGAFTHVDVLFQAYLSLSWCSARMGAPLNPGNPYVGSTKQNGFGTFGGPDFAATIHAPPRAPH